METLIHYSRSPTPIEGRNMEELRSRTDIVTDLVLSRWSRSDDGSVFLTYLDGPNERIHYPDMAKLFDAVRKSVGHLKSVRQVMLRVVINADQHANSAVRLRHKPFYNWHTDMAICERDDQYILRKAISARTAIIFNRAGFEYVDGPMKFKPSEFSVFSFNSNETDVKQLEEVALAGFEGVVAGSDRQFVRGPIEDAGFANRFTTRAADAGEWQDIFPDTVHLTQLEAPLGRAFLEVA